MASKYPETFYGQLAGEKLGQVVTLPRSSSTNPSQGQRASFNNKDFSQAATWLSKAGLDGEAEDFLLKLKNTASSPQDYELTAELASNLGKQHIAIKTAQDLQKKQNVVLGQYLYPQKVEELNGINSTEWAFINAIIRQESRFDHTAVSHAGARGLMQLMPATAKQTASRAGLSHQKSWLTSRPSHNIALGSRYLGQMANRYGGNYAMAAAAYNAGPGRVDRWVKEMGDPRYGSVDFIDWVEQIQFMKHVITFNVCWKVSMCIAIVCMVSNLLSVHLSMLQRASYSHFLLDVVIRHSPRFSRFCSSCLV